MRIRKFRSDAHAALSGLVLVLFLVIPGRAQTDNCADAPNISPGTYFGTTIGATGDGSSLCGSSFGGSDVWFSYVQPNDGVLDLNLCADRCRQEKKAGTRQRELHDSIG